MERPELRDVNKIQVNDWYSLGLKLGISDNSLRTIRQNNPGDVNACKREMFSQWLRQDIHATFQTLVYALCECGENTAAHKMADERGNFITLYLALGYNRSSIRTGCQLNIEAAPQVSPQAPSQVSPQAPSQVSPQAPSQLSLQVLSQVSSQAQSNQTAALDFQAPNTAAKPGVLVCDIFTTAHSPQPSYASLTSPFKNPPSSQTLNIF